MMRTCSLVLRIVPKLDPMKRTLMMIPYYLLGVMKQKRMMAIYHCPIALMKRGTMRIRMKMAMRMKFLAPS